jgi:MSHA biogenesis protein MshI
MDSIQSLKKRIRWPSFLNIKVASFRAGLCCVGLYPGGFTLAQAIESNGEFSLKFCKSFACEPKDFLAILTEKVKENNLAGMKCVWMLQPEDYLLFTMEALPVPEAEFQAAIRWKVKKLLPYSVDDAVIDSFPIPAPLITDPKKSITVVVSQTSKLIPVTQQLNESGLDLDAIDIPELGLRNIISLYENADASIAFVYLRDKNSNLIISRQKEFYLSRRLDLDVNAFMNANESTLESYLDKLSLQLQRSFDYYHSQWRRPAPENVLISMPGNMSAQVQKQLSERLMLPVTAIDLNEKLQSSIELTPEQQSNSLPIIGGALRSEITSNAAN